MAFVEATFQREAWNLRTFLAAELFLLNGKKNGLLVNKDHRGAAAKRRDSENMHSSGADCGHFRDGLRQADQQFAVSVCCTNHPPLVVGEHFRNHNR